jgi:nicotinamidase-related amidase
MEKIIFWNVDTQYDFMRDDDSYRGKLAVPGARDIEENLLRLTQHARENNYGVINTADWHIWGDAEISREPNFVSTYPMHCERETLGAKFVPATDPFNPYVIDCRDGKYEEDKVRTERNIVLYKNQFDAFAGNKLTKEVVNLKNPNSVIVYGVALNVCDDFAIMGNIEAGRKVYAVLDAMKDLPHLAQTPLATNLVLEKWKANKVRFVTTKDVLEGRLK